MMNRFGHGISYSQLAEMETGLCLQKLEDEAEKGFLLPGNIHQGIPRCLAYDNIDRLEETLTCSGGGTSHHVNDIAIQAKVATAPQPKVKIDAGDQVGPPAIKSMPVECD